MERHQAPPNMAEPRLHFIGEEAEEEPANIWTCWSAIECDCECESEKPTGLAGEEPRDEEGVEELDLKFEP